MSRLSRTRNTLRRLMDDDSAAGDERSPRRRAHDVRCEELDRAHATVAE
jgi:hypothetical protein